MLRGACPLLLGLLCGYIYVGYIYTYVCACIYTHTYIYAYMHTYIHTNIHTYILVHTSSSERSWSLHLSTETGGGAKNMIEDMTKHMGWLRLVGSIKL